MISSTSKRIGKYRTLRSLLNNERLEKSENVSSPDSLISWYLDILISWYPDILISWYPDILISWYQQHICFSLPVLSIKRKNSWNEQVRPFCGTSHDPRPKLNKLSELKSFPPINFIVKLSKSSNWKQKKLRNSKVLLFYNI